jgi:hypothetical protein
LRKEDPVKVEEQSHARMSKGHIYNIIRQCLKVEKSERIPILKQYEFAMFLEELSQQNFDETFEIIKGLDYAEGEATKRLYKYK